MNKQRWFTVREIADHFNVSESMVRKLIKNRKLKYHRVGHKILVRIDEFEESVMKTIESAVSDRPNNGMR